MEAELQAALELVKRKKEKKKSVIHLHDCSAFNNLFSKLIFTPGRKEPGTP